MSKAPSADNPELELYRAVMHERMAALRHTTPDLSIPRVDRPNAGGTESGPSAAPCSPGAVAHPGAGRVLLVEDEPSLGRTYQRVLKSRGFDPAWVPDAASALDELRRQEFDVIVSDIGLPDHSGLDLLRHVKNSAPDLPLVLVTGTPELDGAIDAVSLGAFRYLVKPISNDRLLQCVVQAQRSHEMARLLSRSVAGPAGLGSEGDSNLSRAFERALEPLWISYQPIIAWPSRRLRAYQALARREEPSLALPATLVAIARQLGRERDLSHAVHRSVAQTIRGLSGDLRVVVPAYAADLTDPSLYDRASPLGAKAPRVTLEVEPPKTDAAATDLGERLGQLRAMGYQACLRAGTADPNAGFAHGRFPLDAVKLTIRSRAATGQTDEVAIRRVGQWCREQGATLIVEGVDREDQRNRLASREQVLFQDCFFTRPGRASQAR